MLCFLLLFSRLNMDRLSFVSSLLLIFSVATITFGSVIKAKKLNGKVEKEWTYVIAYVQAFCS